jgi:hypothetical protein
MSEKVGSFLPEEFTEGGYFDDKDCTIVKAEVVEFDYAGKSDGGPICALAVTLREDGEDTDENDRTEYYKIGELSKFTPSADRKNYIPVGSTTSMNKGAKAALFLKALKENGFEMSRLAKGIDGLEAVHGHVNIVPMPPIKGVERDLKILIFTKLTDAPGAAKGKSARKTKAEKGEAAETKVASPAAASAVDGAQDKAEEVIVGLITDKGGKVSKAAIPQAMFAAIKSDAQLRNACIALSGKVDWLSSGDRPWSYDGGELVALG